MIMIFGTLVQNDDRHIFLFFFLILIFRAVKGVEGQKMAKNDHNFWYTCVKWWYTRCFFFFFHFLKFFDLPGCCRSKKAKNGPKWQNILSVALNISGIMHHIIVIYGTVVCTLHISGIMHHIIVIYGTVVWNDDISSHFFHFFKILVFWVVRGEKAKNGPKLKKILFVPLHISRTIHHKIVIYGTVV